MGWPTERPGVPRSTRKAVIPMNPRALLTVPKITKRSATGALVTKIFEPWRTYVSPRRSAVVDRPKASDPESGSVMPCAPIHSPLISLGRYVRFWDSEPNLRMGTWTLHIWALTPKMSPLSRHP